MDDDRTTVVVVGHEPFTRVGIAALIRNEPDLSVVGEAADGEAATAVVSAERPRIVIVDLKVSGGCDFETLERIVSGTRAVAPRTMAISDTVDGFAVARALCSGVRALLPRTLSPQRLVAATRVVAEGDIVLSRDVMNSVHDAFASRPELVKRRLPELELLTDREVEVLRLVARGMSNSEISEHCQLCEGTVKTHLSRAMTKLDVNTRAQLVVLAYESGLVRPQGTAEGSTPQVYPDGVS